MTRSVLRVLVMAHILALTAFSSFPAQARPGDALINPVNMSQDLGSRQQIVYDQVYHVVTSYFLRFCIQIQNGNCVLYQSEPAWRVAGGWVERRYDGIFDGYSSGLVWALMDQYHQNVDTQYPNNGRQFSGGPSYYYYCPLDGSADGSIYVGFSWGIDHTPNIGGGFVVANSDVPRGFTNHVYRPSGLEVHNNVYAVQLYTFFDTTQWRWASICNAAKHYLGRTGYEVRVTLYSQSVNIVCCWALVRHLDYSDFRMNF